MFNIFKDVKLLSSELSRVIIDIENIKKQFSNEIERLEKELAAKEGSR